jgi:hypothetical protein
VGVDQVGLNFSHNLRQSTTHLQAPHERETFAWKLVDVRAFDAWRSRRNPTHKVHFVTCGRDRIGPGA